MFFLPFFSHSGLLLKIVCLHFSLYPSIFFLLPRVFFFFASRRCASVYVCVCLCVCKTAKRARSFVKYGAGRLSVTSQDEMPASALPNFPIKANEDGPTAKLWSEPSSFLFIKIFFFLLFYHSLFQFFFFFITFTQFFLTLAISQPSIIAVAWILLKGGSLVGR